MFEATSRQCPCPRDGAALMAEGASDSRRSFGIAAVFIAMKRLVCPRTMAVQLSRHKFPWPVQTRRIKTVALACDKRRLPNTSCIDFLAEDIRRTGHDSSAVHPPACSLQARGG